MAETKYVEEAIMEQQMENKADDGREWVVDERPAVEVVIGEQENAEGEYVEVIENVGSMIELDHDVEHVDYDALDGYPSLLPVRDGIPLLSLNLPDLLSRTITFSNGEKMVICFNKKCTRQVAFSGHLYNIQGFLNETNWNMWKCANPACDGSVRTSPNSQELRVRTEHTPACIPDDRQLRLRIAIYDLRVMAEFTDLSLDLLYTGSESRLKSENSDIAHLLPPIETLRPTLEDHRINKIYRKRFEMQALKDKQKKYQMTPDEVVYAESTAGAYRFRRTKPFPPSFCCECNEEFESGQLPSQDQLVNHVCYTHEKVSIIERYTFKDSNLFEQWIRDMGLHSRHRMKKMGMADEHMYFLCAHDDRLHRNGSGRATKNQAQNLHCTAFIRVYDWRLVMRREIQEAVVDYCLDHCFHKDDDQDFLIPNVALYDFFSPEVFLRELEERRIRTQRMISEHNFQRIRRPDSVMMRTNPCWMNGKRTTFGSRALAPPAAAQVAAGTAQPVVDTFYADAEGSLVMADVEPLRNRRQNKNLRVVDSGVSNGRQYITERAFFRDYNTYIAVCKAEEACETLISRLQNCRSHENALRYKNKLEIICREAMQDKNLVGVDEAQPSNSSSSPQKPSNFITKPNNTGQLVRRAKQLTSETIKVKPPKLVIIDVKHEEEGEVEAVKGELEEFVRTPGQGTPDANSGVKRSRGRPRKNGSPVAAAAEAATSAKRIRLESVVSTTLSESRSGRQLKAPVRLTE